MVLDSIKTIHARYHILKVRKVYLDALLAPKPPTFFQELCSEVAYAFTLCVLGGAGGALVLTLILLKKGF